MPIHFQYFNAENSQFAQLSDLDSSSVGLGHHFSAPLGKTIGGIQPATSPR